MDETPAGDHEQERWLIWRDPSDGGERFGRILSREPGIWMVDSGGRELLVEERKRQQREVDTDDLDLQELRAPGSLRGRFEADPVAVIGDLIRRSLTPPTKDDLLGRLRRYDVGVEPEVWKKLQTKVSKLPNVRTEGRPTRYSWTDEVVLDEDTPELLSKLLNLRSRPETKERAIGALEVRFRAGGLDPVAQAIASAHSPAIPAPPWRDVSLHALDDSRATAVISAAAAAGAWAFLLDIALDPSSTARAREAREALRTAPAEDLGELVTTRLEELRERLRQPEVTGTDHDWVARRLEALVRLIEGAEDPDLAEPFLDTALAVGRVTTDSAALAVRTALEGAVECSRTPAGLGSALLRRSPTNSELHSLQRALDDQPVGPDSTRRRFLAGLTRWERGRTEVESRDWWSGVGVQELGELASDPDLGPVLAGSTVRSAVVGAAAQRSLTNGPEGLAAILTLPPELVGGIDPAAVERALTSLDGAHPVAKALAAAREGAATFERARAEALLAEERARHEAELAALGERIDGLTSELEAAKAQAARLGEELGGALRSGAGVTERQLRQAALDGLTLAVELVAELERSRSVLGADDAQLDAVLARFETMLERAKVRRVGVPGTEIDLDRSRFVVVGDDDPAAQRARVIEPGYELDEDPVTVLRYGRVALI